MVYNEVDMYHTMLVPLNGFKRAEAILPYVEELALNAGAKVICLQVIEPGSIIRGPEGSHLALGAMELE